MLKPPPKSTEHASHLPLHFPMHQRSRVLEKSTAFSVYPTTCPPLHPPTNSYTTTFTHLIPYTIHFPVMKPLHVSRARLHPGLPQQILPSRTALDPRALLQRPRTAHGSRPRAAMEPGARPIYAADE